MLPCKLSRGKLSFIVVIAGLLSLGLSSAAQESAVSSGPVASRIVNRIDESRLVTLKGTVHPLANARNDRGAAPESMQLTRMHLVLKRSDSQEAALRQLINDMHTPGTASYHKWLTPDQFGKQFGPSDQDITSVTTWLAQQGFSVTKVNPGKQTIEFAGNVAQMRTAFHTQIHKYEVNGESHYANAGDPQIPAALAPVVGGFVSLNNFRVKSHATSLGKALYDPKTDHAQPQWTIGNSTEGYNFALAPADYAVQYDLAPLYAVGTNGAGQTIAIVNESNINVDLANQFRSLFSMPANPPQVIVDGNDPGIDGINNPDGPNGASIEAYLDVEWSGAVAPAATIDLVIAGDSEVEPGLFLAAERAVYSNIAPIISLSFGNCEASLGTTNAFLSSLWEQAAAQGITVMVSTGDAGSAGCDNDNVQEYAYQGQAVSGFASTPFNVAVGGTDFYYSDFSQGLTAVENQLPTYWSLTPSNSTPAQSIKGVIPEQPWNASQFGLTLETLEQGSSPTSTSIAGGSGGASSLYTKPAWQTSLTPADGARDIPDVSLFASSGSNASFYPECWQDGDCQPASSGGTVQITGVGGTSASAPSFAGIMALINQKYGRQGQADYVLYPLAAQFPLAFHDVTAGTNSVPCAIGSVDCIAVSPALTITDPNLGTAVEGQIGTGTTPEYNAKTGYDLASGLGTIDANVLVTDWPNVTFKASTTTLTPSETTFTHGTAITISGSVTATSGTPTGNVALMTSSTEPGQQGQPFFTLASGAYTGSVNSLPGGTYNIWGQYGGDGVNGSSSSNPVQIIVNPENSTLPLNIDSPSAQFTAPASPGTSVDYGTQLELSAQPAPSSAASSFTYPTGTVTFSDSSKPINTAVLNARGNAEYNAPFSIGAHTVTASYSGDNSYNKSTSQAIAFTVVKDTPTLNVYSSLIDGSNGDVVNGSGQPTVLTIVVANGAQVNAATAPVPVAAPSGTVTLTGLPSGVPTSATLAPGVDPVLQGGTGAVVGIASFVVPAGTLSGSTTTYNVNVGYSGDTNYLALSAEKASLPVENPNTFGTLATTMSASMTGSISPTSNIVVTGTITGASGHPAPTGSVEIYSSGYFVGGGNVAPGTSDVSNFSVVLNSQSLSQGANFVTIQYFGDTVYSPSAATLNSGNSISNPLSDFTLVPSTAIVPINLSGGAATGTVTVNLGSVNGFSGVVNLTCTGAAGIPCSIPSAESLTSGGSATATLTINAPSPDTANLPFNVYVTGTDAATGKFVHTAAIQVVISGSAAGSSSFSLTANPTTVNVNTGSSVTSTITVAPEGVFTGTVDLTCAVTTAIPSVTSPATCLMAAPSSVTSGSGTDVLTIGTTSTTTNGAYTVTVTGTSGPLTQTTTVTVNVGTPSFALSNGGGITVAAGATTGNTSMITITPTDFGGMVNLTCSISPTAANAPATCSFSPSTVNVTGSTATSTLSIGTTAATTALNKPKDLFWPSAGGVVLALVVFLGIPARKRNWPSLVGLLVLFVSVGAIGCGGGSSGGGGGGGGGTGSPGTTAGAYTVTVTGTSGTGSSAITATTTLTLTVQ